MQNKNKLQLFAALQSNEMQNTYGTYILHPLNSYYNCTIKHIESNGRGETEDYIYLLLFYILCG